MTITMARGCGRPSVEFDKLKSAKTGSTFLVRDNDGEDWAIIKTEEDDMQYVVLGSTEENYYPGTTYNEEELREALEDYRATVEQVDFELKVDNE